MTIRLLLLLFIITVNVATGQNQNVGKVLQSVNPNAIKATMSFLSDDLLEGRQPGTRGFALASRYVQSQFMSLGLTPAGNDNSYIQKVPLKKGVVNKNESRFVIESPEAESWTYGSEFLFAPNLVDGRSEVAAPLVFVGFGISAPELKYDDYKGIDVRGKIVVMLDQAPDIFGNNERAYFSSPNIKLQEAVKQGAVGVITINLSGRTSWEAMVRRSGQGTFKWVDSQNNPANAFAELKVVATLNPANQDKLFMNSKKNLQEVYTLLKRGKVQSFPLKLNVRLQVVTSHSMIESANLIGVIPGSDSALKNEYIVYAAHVDHFGIGAPVKGDSIYNGAHDNASGVAIVLEIARLFRSLPEAPKRSIIIAIVTGEESGLLGSDYFANNPTVTGPLVANFALDMPFFFHPVLDIVPYGIQHSSLSKHVTTAADALHLKISPDPFPEQVVFVRSDHFSFIKKGIPALFIKSGFQTSPQDSIDRAKSDVAWRSTTYHTPHDDMQQNFDFNGAVMHAKINFLIGLLTANDTAKPTWNKGDFFGEKFGK
jgi:Zn-dependent M28 family amino/carboxypeptidase